MDNRAAVQPGAAHPLGSQKGVDLVHPVTSAQTEMRHEQLNRGGKCGHLDPQSTARLALCRQASALDEPHRQGADDRVSVGLLLDLEGRMKMGGHGQMAGNHLYLINQPAALSADIDLLEGDDIGLARSNDLGDSDGIPPPINAKTGMNVIGGQAKPMDHKIPYANF